MDRRRLRNWRWLSPCVVGLSVGCATDRVTLPNGYLPPPAVALDTQTTAALNTPAPKPATRPTPPADPKKPAFDLPRALPGADAAPVTRPTFDKDTPAAEREKRVLAAYPRLVPVSAVRPGDDQPPVDLADLVQTAVANSPVIRKAQADADAAHGQVVQAGLHPNPTVGYQADQIQPRLNIPPGATFSGAGQQGGFINLLIKTAGKLTLAQQVAGYDHINALVAVRRATVDVTAAVRTSYFNLLVARYTLEVNRALADLADEVYALQLRRVMGGQANGYEPQPLYAQAVQARNAVAQAEAGYKAAWKQLAAAVGNPDLPVAPVNGRADTPAPAFDPAAALARVREQHTDLLTARNGIAQAQRNLVLQKRVPIPDIATNQYHQYDNAAQTYQFGVQIGLAIPVFDRNQGNVRTAHAQILSAGEKLRAAENDLSGKLAEAFGRYEANVKVAANYREAVLPHLSQAYRGLIRQYQVEPDKVGFNDIVVAQQNLAQAIQSYLTAVGGQWQAVVDVATVAQMDELYPAK